MEHPLYNELDWADKNIIKWVCLLHDMKKLSVPAIEGKDHVHPFKSAACVLDIFQKLKILDFPKKSWQEESLEQVKRLIGESVKPID